MRAIADMPDVRSLGPVQGGEGLSIGGRRYAQAPFRYQGKCHDALRRKLAGLPGEVRRRLDPVLEETGCIHHLG